MKVRKVYKPNLYLLKTRRGFGKQCEVFVGVCSEGEEGLDHLEDFSEVILFCRVCEALWGPEQMKGAI